MGLKQTLLNSLSALNDLLRPEKKQDTDFLLFKKYFHPILLIAFQAFPCPKKYSVNTLSYSLCSCF